MKNINEEISRIKSMMGLNEDGTTPQSQNPTGTTKRKWTDGVGRGPANPIGNAPAAIKTAHGRANPIELSEDESTKLESFAETRLGGAEKIVNNAKEKGGLALLTYHHFEVKLEYYEKASKGELDMEDAKKEYKDLLEKLHTSTKDDMGIEQIDFQELLGKMEVLGELIIKENEKGA
jgi:hypothetical protein